jgi:hypothetical protein
VLARLDAISGVGESRCEASGRLFLLVLADGADEARVVADAIAALRGRAARLDPAAATAQLEARPRGDPWFSAGEIRALSYLEARVVAASTAARIAGAAALASGAHESLAEALRVELFAAIERVHAAGGRESSGWFYLEWPAIAAAAATRAGGALGPGARERVLAALRDAHAR